MADQQLLGKSLARGFVPKRHVWPLSACPICIRTKESVLRLSSTASPAPPQHPPPNARRFSSWCSPVTAMTPWGHDSSDVVSQSPQGVAADRDALQTKRRSPRTAAITGVGMSLFRTAGATVAPVAASTFTFTPTSSETALKIQGPASGKRRHWAAALIFRALASLGFAPDALAAMIFVGLVVLQCRGVGPSKCFTALRIKKTREGLGTYVASGRRPTTHGFRTR